MKETDAPELKQPFGKRSRQWLADMCAAKRARLIWTEKDRNGRLLARVWCSETDANAEQVRRGMAWVFDRYVKDRSLYPLQERARAQRLDLWVDDQAHAAVGMAGGEGGTGIKGREVVSRSFGPRAAPRRLFFRPLRVLQNPRREKPTPRAV